MRPGSVTRRPHEQRQLNLYYFSCSAGRSRSVKGTNVTGSKKKALAVKNHSHLLKKSRTMNFLRNVANNLATHSQKWLRSKHLDAIWYMAPVVASTAIPLVTLPLYTRVLAPKDFGKWAIGVSVGVLVSGAMSLGLQAGFEREYFSSDDQSKREKLLYSILVLSTGLQMAGYFALCALIPVISHRLLNTGPEWKLLSMGFAVPAIGIIKGFLLTTLRSQNRAKEYALFSVDEIFIATAITGVCVLVLEWGPIGLLMGPLTAGTVMTFALMYRLRPYIEPRFDEAQVKEVLRISLPLAPRVFIGSIGNQLDRLVLATAGSLASVGLYAIGQRISQVVFAFLSALGNVYQPAVYRLLFKQANPAQIGEFLLPYGYISALIALSTILFAEEILGLFTTTQYAQASPIVSILAAHYGLMFFAKQPQLLYARRTGLISMLSLGTVGLNTAFIYIGSRLASSIGVALGVLVAGIISGGVSLYFANRFAPIHYPKTATIVIFSILPVGAILTGMAKYWQLAGPTLIAGKCALLLLFLFLGWKADFFKKQPLS